MNHCLFGKNILFVFPGPELGGAERQGMHLSRYLKRRGCEVHVWSTLAGHGRVVEECAKENIPWAAYRFLWPCRKSSLIRDGWRLIRAFRQLRPDVILPYTTSPNVGCGLFWRFSRAGVCIWGQRNTDDLRGDVMERLAYRLVSAVICNATHEKAYLKEKLGEPTGSLHVIHNGLDFTPPKKNRHAWRAELNIDADALVGVMLANFRPQKDHATLLYAWSKVLRENPGQPSPCIVLAGAPQSTFDDVKRLAGELSMLETIRFPGQVNDVAGLLSACDLGILISKKEGLSNAVLEYMAAGLPVIATDLPGNWEALGRNCEAQLCTSGDSSDLARQIQLFLDGPELRQELGKQNKHRADTLFSIQAMCHRTIKILSELLQEKT